MRVDAVINFIVLLLWCPAMVFTYKTLRSQRQVNAMAAWLRDNANEKYKDFSLTAIFLQSRLNHVEAHLKAMDPAYETFADTNRRLVAEKKAAAERDAQN